ncbi:LOW QUALITY PROTEIN: protein O-linked-mannose beta-1,2-N-acetylglucosaminyltransferase 1-like [Panulirus ornatus]|uniref:LOW QUALITY PROTEIN: protein O-linked-mannose beta-1,2-N-acetylglucosaminyltransferase 1-like n=1 Tax=Panulirus ornatus TaxID=150431 RepID=UPI003A8B403D
MWVLRLQMAMVVTALVTGVKGELSIRWRNIGRDRGFRPYDLEAHGRIQEARTRHTLLSVRLNRTSVELRIDDQQVYERVGEEVTSVRHGGVHSGVHVLVVHEARARLMMARQFRTYQPAEHARLTACLSAVQPGRVVVLVGMPEWVMFLGRGAEDALKGLGTTWAAQMAQGEAWSWVGVMGGPTLAEAGTTRELGRYPASSLALEVFVHKTEPGKHCSKVRCPWYTLPGLRRQASFCERYEGYSDLCICHRPFFPETRKLQPFIPTQESIPVVVVTANKPYYLYRLLRQLFTMAGAWQTEVLVTVDGPNQETLALVEVMGVGLVIHRPEGDDKNRTNANVRFALHSVFEYFPRADKAIVLEDDLILSPDFLRFFHQVSPVLDRDPSVYCVNAYSSNSFGDTASDPRVLLRARTYPMYGWMVTRRYASEVIRMWVPPWVSGDWDLWLAFEDLRKGRDVVFPEVSRTFHMGSSGVHVSGFEQEVFFNRMVYNLLPEVTLMDINEVVRSTYDERLSRDLEVATLVTPPRRDLCNMTWAPRNSPRPLVVYLYAHDHSDKYESFRIFLMCFRTYDHSTREIYKGLIRLRWHGTLVYLVGCPLSPFCVHKPARTQLYKPGLRDLRDAARYRDDWDMTFFQQNPRLARDPNLTPDLNLTNLITRPAAQPTEPPNP